MASLAVAIAVIASIAVADRFAPSAGDAKHAAAVLSASMASDETACESQPDGAVCPVSIELGGSLSTGASGVVPGDTMARAVTITNDGRTDLSMIRLTVTPARATPLRLKVERCDQPWTETQTNVYACTRPAAVLGDRPITIIDADLGRLAALRRGGTDHLLFTVAFPNDASIDESGTSTRVDYDFTAVQATSRGKRR